MKKLLIAVSLLSASAVSAQSFPAEVTSQLPAGYVETVTYSGNLYCGGIAQPQIAGTQAPVLNAYCTNNYLYVHRDTFAIPFSIYNKDPLKRVATVDATCTINYDKNERFLFGPDEPTPPDVVTRTLKNANNNQLAMLPGANTGVLVFQKGNGKIDYVECKIDSATLHAPDLVQRMFASIGSWFE